MVGGMDLVNQLSVREHELIPVSYTVGGINHGQLELLGGLLVNISLGDREHQELCYIAKGVKEVLLSGATMKALGIISENFPAVGAEIPRCELRDGGRGNLAGPQYPQQMVGLWAAPAHTQLHPNLQRVFPSGQLFPIWTPPWNSGQFTDMSTGDSQVWPASTTCQWPALPSLAGRREEGDRHQTKFVR